MSNFQAEFNHSRKKKNNNFYANFDRPEIFNTKNPNLKAVGHTFRKYMASLRIKNHGKENSVKRVKMRKKVGMSVSISLPDFLGPHLSRGRSLMSHIEV